MRVEDCIVSVERRTFGGCLDLAFVFARRFAVPILRLQLLFAIPGCVIVWWMARSFVDMLIPSLLVFSGLAALFSGALVAAMGPQVFGVPISTRRALKQLTTRFTVYSFYVIIARAFQLVGAFCFFVPSVMVTVFFGYLAEIVFLEQATLAQVTKRLNALGGGHGFSLNLLRLIVLILFWLLASVGTLLLIDLLYATVFNTPIVFGRIAVGPDMVDAIISLLKEDPLLLTAVQASLWVPFPIVRLAWFFCYLDQRIRNECWDLEVQFRVEALRLQGAT